VDLLKYLDHLIGFIAVTVGVVAYVHRNFSSFHYVEERHREAMKVVEENKREMERRLNTLELSIKDLLLEIRELSKGIEARLWEVYKESRRTNRLEE
jgi:hypothetical protein